MLTPCSRSALPPKRYETVRTCILQVLRKYSDKTVARDLVREIEAFAPAFSRMSLSLALVLFL
jgi:hypothetical protein